MKKRKTAPSKGVRRQSMDPRALFGRSPIKPEADDKPLTPTRSAQRRKRLSDVPL